ncbi:thymidine phosphorylase family protein [Novosphingobium pentaromativorans]|uniref:Putative thymidine phosphorylase n=1 Tax=Novosphingobium pentaromativorans US6-1 TaxID=1088721 RepID=G6EF82_9SPHN|nr:thymidine phosphorylase family protein [Novosphingobium pentaromativorans]AIT79193.1 thymidine phosphorylase [Novosphingobium pentaromativorans US6-1]EHJ60040.1 thymidine phosphorylase [Novosphingobium pentaromativorans US6-1]
MKKDVHSLALTRAGIDTYRQPVVYMREDCDLCRAEGFSALTKVGIVLGERSIVAALNVVTAADWLSREDAGLSEAAWQALNAQDGDLATFFHPEPAQATSSIRAKVYGQRLDAAACQAIVSDTIGHRLSDLDLAAFITACAGNRLDIDETIALTRAMKEAGQTLDWGQGPVLDKHCVGGLPGNRTTPIVVAIVAAAGFRIPKTSSRAITSPAGTADTVEVMTPVALDLAAMRRVVDLEGGCLVWGGKLDLSPADDLFVRIERPLDFDSDGQLVASVLSKKAAAGSSHVLIDMPVGPTAKIRSPEAARSLSQRLLAVGDALNLKLLIHHSDGSAPVGRGIGPALEARDLLAVLRRDKHAPLDLRERALDLAGALFDLIGDDAHRGRSKAVELLDNGAAERKFFAICDAQGGFSEPGAAAHRLPIVASSSGLVRAIDNRRIGKIAKLAGAPNRKLAGVLLMTKPGVRVDQGETLYEIHAETPGELAWAKDFAMAGPEPVILENQS